MLTLQLTNHNLTLINFNEYFTNECQTDILNDLYKYKLLQEKNDLNDKNIKKIFYHHLIHKICETSLLNDTGQPVLYCNIASTNNYTLEQFFDKDDILQFFDKFMIKISKILPIKIYRSKISLEQLQQFINDNDARAYITINAIVNMINKFNKKAYTLENIKKFTKKYELLFLNEDYFKRIKTKQLLI